MSIDVEAAAEQVLARGGKRQCWPTLKLSGEEPGDIPLIPLQREDGAFLEHQPEGGYRRQPRHKFSHLRLIELQASDSARRAGDWLEGAKTPSQAWTDTAEHVPGQLTTPGGIEVWATTAAACGLLSLGRDPGPRAIDLLRGEADLEGRRERRGHPDLRRSRRLLAHRRTQDRDGRVGAALGAGEHRKSGGPRSWRAPLVF